MNRVRPEIWSSPKWGTFVREPLVRGPLLNARDAHLTLSSTNDAWRQTDSPWSTRLKPPTLREIPRNLVGNTSS